MKTTSIKTRKIMDGMYLQELDRKVDKNGNVKVKYGLLFANRVNGPESTSAWFFESHTDDDFKGVAISLLKEMYPRIDITAGAMERDIMEHAKKISEVQMNGQIYLYFDKCVADGSPDRVAFDTKKLYWTVI